MIDKNFTPPTLDTMITFLGVAGVGNPILYEELLSTSKTIEFIDYFKSGHWLVQILGYPQYPHIESIFFEHLQKQEPNILARLIEISTQYYWKDKPLGLKAIQLLEATYQYKKLSIHLKDTSTLKHNHTIKI